MPMPPQAVQSIAIARRSSGPPVREVVRQLAEQVVRGRVVRLAVVAETPCDRAESDRRPDGQPRLAFSRLKKPPAFTSKTRSNCSGCLSGSVLSISSPAACTSRSIRPYAARISSTTACTAAVAKIQAAIEGSATRRFDPFHRGKGRNLPLDRAICRSMSAGFGLPPASACRLDQPLLEHVPAFAEQADVLVVTFGQWARSSR